MKSWLKNKFLIVLAFPGITWIICGLLLPFLYFFLSSFILTILGKTETEHLPLWAWIPAAVACVSLFILMLIIYEIREKYATIAKKDELLIKISSDERFEKIGYFALWGKESKNSFFRLRCEHFGNHPIRFYENTFKTTINVWEKEELSIIFIPTTFSITTKELMEEHDWEEIVKTMKIYKVNNFQDLLEERATKLLNLYKEQTDAQIKEFRAGLITEHVLQENILKILQEAKFFYYNFIEKMSIELGKPNSKAIFEVKI